jgi:hypothetical protein
VVEGGSTPVGAHRVPGKATLDFPIGSNQNSQSAKCPGARQPASADVIGVLVIRDLARGRVKLEEGLKNFQLPPRICTQKRTLKLCFTSLIHFPSESQAGQLGLVTALGYICHLLCR